MKKIKIIVLIASVVVGYISQMEAALNRLMLENPATARTAGQLATRETARATQEAKKQAVHLRTTMLENSAETTAISPSEQPTEIKQESPFFKPRKSNLYSDTLGYKHYDVIGAFKNWLGQKFAWTGWSNTVPEVSQVLSEQINPPVSAELSIPKKEATRLIRRNTKVTNLPSSPLPFGGGSRATRLPTKLQARSYSTGPTINESEKSGSDIPTFGWWSLVPGSKEYQQKNLINSMDQLVKKMQQPDILAKFKLRDHLAEYEDLHSQYKKLIPGKGYNPIERYPLLLKRTLGYFLMLDEKDKDRVFWSRILKRLYDLNCRLSVQDIQDVLKNVSWNGRDPNVYPVISPARSELYSKMEFLFDKMEQKGITFDDLNEYKILRSQYKKLDPTHDYNPIELYPSLLKIAAKRILGRAQQYSLRDDEHILATLYDLGCRLSLKDIDEVIKSTHWDEKIKNITNLVDEVKNDENLTVEKIGKVASAIISIDRVFKSFGIDISPYSSRPLNMKYMGRLASDWESIKRQTSYTTRVTVNGKEQWAHARLDDRPLSYIKSNFTAGEHMSGDAADLLRKMREKDFVYEFLEMARTAGFFRSTISEEAPVKQKDSFDNMYNALMQNGKYIPDKKLFRSFMQMYAPDKLKPKLNSGEITQEQYRYYENKIASLNSARDEYKKLIK